MRKLYEILGIGLISLSSFFSSCSLVTVNEAKEIKDLLKDVANEILESEIEKNKSYVSLYKKLGNGDIDALERDLRSNIYDSLEGLTTAKQEIKSLEEYGLYLDSSLQSELEEQIKFSKEILVD